MATMNRLWVLGASDPEMAAIETLLAQAGESVAYATLAGARIHPGNAYQAETLSDFPHGPIDEVVLVECGFKEPDQVLGLVFGQTGGHGKVTIVDHHRPGDPGYGCRSEEFLAASSIGQVYLILQGREIEFEFVLGQWRISWWSDPQEEGGLGTDHHSLGDIVSQEIILVAAADHCLEVAYRGKCPGVDPDELMKWRAKTRAEFQRRAGDEVLRDVRASVRAL